MQVESGLAVLDPSLFIVGILRRRAVSICVVLTICGTKYRIITILFFHYKRAFRRCQWASLLSMTSIWPSKSAPSIISMRGAFICARTVAFGRMVILSEALIEPLNRPRIAARATLHSAASTAAPCAIRTKLPSIEPCSAQRRSSGRLDRSVPLRRTAGPMLVA